MSLTKGAGEVEVCVFGGAGRLQEQPQGLEFPTPGAVLLFGLHFASTAAHGGASGDGRGIGHEGPIVPAESMSLGLKVETNGRGLVQLGARLYGRINWSQ